MTQSTQQNHPLRRLRAGVKRVLAKLLLNRHAAACLSRAYGALPAGSHARLHRRLAKLFLAFRTPAAGESAWILNFASRRFSMPLRSSHLAVDWDNLLSVFGAELEVKSPYRAWLAGPPELRPEVFVDCGASYGTHSLLWALHGTPVVAFEPNPECHATFARLMESVPRNPILHPCAVGASTGIATLRYPADSTWVGQVGQPGDTQTDAPADPGAGWRTVEVEVVALDDMRSTIPAGRLLVKLDVEGFELEALRGAVRLLHERRPVLLFECTKPALLEDLTSFLAVARYTVAPLVSPPGGAPRPINFLASPLP